MNAQSLAITYATDRTVPTAEGGTRPMTRAEMATARRYIRRTPKRDAWNTQRQAAALHIFAVRRVANASGVTS